MALIYALCGMQSMYTYVHVTLVLAIVQQQGAYNRSVQTLLLYAATIQNLTVIGLLVRSRFHADFRGVISCLGTIASGNDYIIHQMSRFIPVQ